MYTEQQFFFIVNWNNKYSEFGFATHSLSNMADELSKDITIYPVDNNALKQPYCRVVFMASGPFYTEFISL